jgi:glycosyltransferase involved in cell wall biosynthesis
VSRRTGVPFVVESFEPHSEYMADTGVWRRGGILYSALHRMEVRTIRRAMFLITVARRYRDHLVAQGVPADRVLMAPCPVDVMQFRPDAMARDRVRRELGLGDAITGIYVGKFGGLYLRDEAFRVFTSIHRRLQGNFKLIVLTPDPREEVLGNLEDAGFPGTDARVARVPHERVPEHLNAADFAMALYRRTPSSGFLSPVKVGEYWACGLPVLLTRGVGDEERIIGEGGTGGALFDPAAGDLAAAVDRILDRTGANDQTAIRELALRHRSIEHTRAAYVRVLTALQSRR